MTINTIGRSQGHYPCLRDFKRMLEEDYSGLGKTKINSLKFWKSVFDLSILKEDPYLEDLKSIENLHKQILELPVWMFTFSKMKSSFSLEKLIEACKETFKDASDRAISRDVKAFLKMYSEYAPENPFFELGLIKFDGKKYKIERNIK